MKKIFTAVLIGGLLAFPAIGQEVKKTGTGISEWLKALEQRIEKMIPAKTVPMSTSVAGVRGAKEDARVKLYWKGKKGNEETVTEKELAQFKAALDEAAKGNHAAAAKDIDTFMKEYPDSPLIPDAKKTLDLVSVEGNREVKPGVKEEKKDEVKDDKK